jgi:hypothetical protein
MIMMLPGCKPCASAYCLIRAGPASLLPSPAAPSPPAAVARPGRCPRSCCTVQVAVFRHGEGSSVASAAVRKVLRVAFTEAVSRTSSKPASQVGPLIMMPLVCAPARATMRLA